MIFYFLLSRDKNQGTRCFGVGWLHVRVTGTLILNAAWKACRSATVMTLSSPRSESRVCESMLLMSSIIKALATHSRSRLSTDKALGIEHSVLEGVPTKFEAQTLVRFHLLYFFRGYAEKGCIKIFDVMDEVVSGDCIGSSLCNAESRRSHGSNRCRDTSPEPSCLASRNCHNFSGEVLLPAVLQAISTIAMPSDISKTWLSFVSRKVFILSKLVITLNVCVMFSEW